MSARSFQTFWHGPPLSPYEQLALRSFLDHGHEVVVWTYDAELAVPPGVRRAAAAEIVPREEAFVLAGYDAQGGHVAFSNLFRFELLAQRGGWWVDLDVVCLRRDIAEPDVFLALERTGPPACEVGSAVLRFPAGHELPRRCAAECRAVAGRLRRLEGGVSPRHFGQLGAGLLERLTAELGYCELAQGPSTCYPVHWSEVPALFSPTEREAIEARTAGAVMVHLWNERLVAAGRDKWRRPPRGSYLDALCERHRIEFPRRPPDRETRSPGGGIFRRLRAGWRRGGG